MNDDAKVIRALVGRTVELQARCDALGGILVHLMMKQGIPQEKAEKAVEKATAHFHQKRLERIEDFDPGAAAALDDRSLPSDTFD